MKKKLIFKIIAFTVAGYLLATARVESSFADTVYPSFSLTDAPSIAKIEINFGPGAVQTINLQEQGSTLHIAASEATWTTPWTAYLPFYQFGRIDGTRAFQYHIDGQPAKPDQVSLAQHVRCFSVLPRHDRSRQLELVLAKVLENGVKIRAQEANQRKANQVPTPAPAPASSPAP